MDSPPPPSYTPAQTPSTRRGKTRALQSAAAFKAAGFGSDAVAANAARRALTKGDANHFTVTFDNEEASAGWSKRPSMPQHLQARVQKLQKKFASKDDFATKQKKAEANRAAFHNAIAAKAAEENDKVMNAQSRKAVAKGAEGQIFSVSATQESTETTTGWGAAKTMPAHLSQRLQTLQKKFASKDDFATKQKKAEANRAAFHNAVAAKAAEENDKVMNAQSRKAVAKGAEGQIFSVSAAQESTRPPPDGALPDHARPPLTASPNAPEEIREQG